jgi:plasmid stabilization system protein ParE
MLKVEYSPKALEDLQDLNIYIAENWGTDVSNKILKKIVSSVRNLELYPSSGASLGKIINVETDYRYIFIEKNYVFYRLESSKIKIVRILNEHQDYILQLFDISSDAEK